MSCLRLEFGDLRVSIQEATLGHQRASVPAPSTALP
jgi:hypothetical protein